MTDFSFVILYVDNPPKAAEFYAGLLGKPAIDSAPTFAMLPLREGVMLGLWQRGEVVPKASAPAGGNEIAFTVADDAAVTALHRQWKGRGLTIIQPPEKRDFGFTFTALDPDGHRLRVLAPGAR